MKAAEYYTQGGIVTDALKSDLIDIAPGSFHKLFHLETLNGESYRRFTFPEERKIISDLSKAAISSVGEQSRLFAEKLVNYVQKLHDGAHTISKSEIEAYEKFAASEQLSKQANLILPD
jgi:hypothetical protein